MMVETPAPVQFLNNQAIIHASTRSTGGQYALIEVHGMAGSRTPVHVHHRDAEGFYVIEGRLRLYIGNRAVIVRRGQFVLAESGVPHALVVEAGNPARWLVTSGGGFDRFVVAVAAAAEGSLSDQPADLRRIGREFGIEILDPAG